MSSDTFSSLLLNVLEAVTPRLRIWDQQQLRATCTAVRAQMEHVKPELQDGLLVAAQAHRPPRFHAVLRTESCARWAVILFSLLSASITLLGASTKSTESLQQSLQVGR